MQNGQPADRQALLAMLAALRPVLASSHGAGLRILSGTTRSPTLGAAIGAVLARYPEARWHQHDAISRAAVRQGAAIAYGGAVDVLPRAGRGGRDPGARQRPARVPRPAMCATRAISHRGATRPARR